MNTAAAKQMNNYHTHIYIKKYRQSGRRRRDHAKKIHWTTYGGQDGTGRGGVGWDEIVRTERRVSTHPKLADGI